LQILAAIVHDQPARRAIETFAFQRCSPSYKLPQF